MLHVSVDEFVSIHASSKNWKDLALRLGNTPDPKASKFGGMKCHIIKRIQQKALFLGLDSSHFLHWNSGNSKYIEVKDDFLWEVVPQSTSYNQVLKKCNYHKLHKPSLIQRINDLKISTTHFRRKNVFIPKTRGTVRTKSAKMHLTSDEIVRQLVRVSTGWTSFAANFGYRLFGVYEKWKWNRRFEELGIDKSHFFKRKTTEEIFVINGSRTTCTTTLKKRLLRDLHWPYKCQKCQNVSFVERDGGLFWMGDPVVLQLDHINGVRTDNRLENLRFMCSLCHAQTRTFCGKNQKKAIDINSWIEEEYPEPSSSSP